MTRVKLNLSLAELSTIERACAEYLLTIEARGVKPDERRLRYALKKALAVVAEQRQKQLAGAKGAA